MVVEVLGSQKGTAHGRCFCAGSNKEGEVNGNNEGVSKDGSSGVGG